MPGLLGNLNAPDSAAGKQVKCPKPGCGTVMIIPEELEAAEVEPRPRRRPAEDDDRQRNRRRRDEVDDDDDRPRKRKKKKQSGMGAGAIAAIVLGGILLLGGAAAGIYFLVGKKDDTAGGGGSKSAVPTGWIEFKSNSDNFRAYFPKPVLSGPFRNPNRDLPPPRSITQYVSGTKADSQIIVVYVAQLQPGSTAEVREAWAADFNKAWRGARDSNERTVTWAGHSATEFSISKSAVGNDPSSGIVVRQMAVGDTLYGAVYAHKGSQPTADVNGFFDNFEILK